MIPLSVCRTLQQEVAPKFQTSKVAELKISFYVSIYYNYLGQHFNFKFCKVLFSFLGLLGHKYSAYSNLHIEIGAQYFYGYQFE